MHRRADLHDSTDDVRVSVYFCPRLREDLQVQHSYCFSLAILHSVRRGEPYSISITVFRVVPRVAHLDEACVKTKFVGTYRLNDFAFRLDRLSVWRLELVGAGGQLESMTAGTLLWYRSLRIKCKPKVALVLHKGRGTAIVS